jgi:hypothetical protein
MSNSAERLTTCGRQASHLFCRQLPTKQLVRSVANAEKSQEGFANGIKIWDELCHQVTSKGRNWIRLANFSDDSQAPAALGNVVCDAAGGAGLAHTACRITNNREASLPAVMSRSENSPAVSKLEVAHIMLPHNYCADEC